MHRLTVPLAAGGAAAAILLAPAATAQPACDQTGAGVPQQGQEAGVCQSPGDAQIDAKLPDVVTPGYHLGGNDGFQVR